MANLRNNTTTIQSILETVKSLPEAGSGGGSDISAEELVVTPSTTQQNYPPAGETKLYSTVTINAVNEELVKSLYPNRVDTTLGDDVKASEDSILSGKKAYVNGEEVEGSIPTKSNIDLTPSGATITGPAGYYSNGISKSVNTGTLGTPSIDSKTGIVSSTVAAAGYLAANASTPDNNLLELTTMEGNINNPITPSTTSKKVVSAGTYTTGDVYVGAIPNQKTGGTYTLNPGESISRAAGTYLTSNLKVTAAASGGSGYVGSSISSSRQSYNSPNSYCIFKDIDTTNLIGFVLDIEGNGADAPSSWRETIVGGLYTKSNGFQCATIDEAGKYWGFSNYSKCTVEISGTTITIASGYSDTRLDTTFDYCIYPIYSA